MRLRTLTLILALLTGVGVRAQGNPPGSGSSFYTVSTSTGAPTGTCGPNSLNIDILTGNIYSCLSGSWVLKGAGGGGGTVTAVTGTAPIVSSGGATPAISCPTCQTGSPAFSAITSGTNTAAAMVLGSGSSLATSGTATITTSTPGVFTNTTMNEPFLFQTNPSGLTNCDPSHIINGGGAQTVKLTDGVASVVCVPASGVSNGFSNGFGAYLMNGGSSTAGPFGNQGAVGFYSGVVCNGGSAANTKCWGANFSVTDGTALPGTLFGNEYDIQSNNTTTSGAGTLYSFRGAGQPTANNLPALLIQAPQSTATFTSGLNCADGSMASGATDAWGCVNIGQQVAGNSQDSQFAWWNAHAGATPLATGVSLTQDNFTRWFNTNGMQLAMDSPGGPGFVEAFGITLKATVSLTAGQLVKIDTANADSVVLCTTADTICHGFVQGSTVYCAISSLHCGITTVPGSKAFGILGTGTCAIGNNVVVDTTTNGRIKCQAGVPAQGTWIGIALSAQSTVGNTVDILTKFQ
jgi:hypothetical protein